MFAEEGLSAPPEGDIAALAAKVQRSSGVAGGKKKGPKKSQELQESLQVVPPLCGGFSNFYLSRL